MKTSLLTCAIEKAEKCLLAFAFLITVTFSAQAVTKTSTGTGNWNTAATWSPSGVPASGDDVVIVSGHTITVDSIFACNNLNLGNATNANATLQITSAANSLTINGDLKINPSAKAKIFTLDAGPGTINISGTFGTWSTTGTNNIKVGTGTINFTPAITISSTKQVITFTGAGTINFLSSFTDQYNELITYSGCTVNFSSSYTVNTTAATWSGNGTANFANGASITATSNLTLNNVTINSSASVTINSAAGTLIMGGSLTLSSGATLTTNQNFEVGGSWTNNGGTFSGNAYTVTFNGSSNTIGGTGSTTFGTIQMGRTAGSTTVSYTLGRSGTCNYLTFAGTASAKTLSIGSGITLTINNDVTFNQPTGAVTNLLSVGAGTCNVSGNLVFSGTSGVTSRVAKIDITSGTFSLTGTVTWMGNTVVETEVITVSTGNVTFGSSLTMGSASGTLAVTSTGTINFNGSSAPSFTLGGATAPVFTTTNGCTINFAKGFTNTTAALTFAATSQVNITGNGTITPTTAITFGHLGVNTSVAAIIASGGAVTVAGNVSIASGATLTTNQSFEVGGNWTNNGGTFSGNSYTITLNSASGTIDGTGTTSFGTLQIGRTSGSTAVAYTMNNDNACNYLNINGSTVNRTLTVSSGKTLTINNDLTLNQPTAASITTLLEVGSGTCNVSGNLIFSGTNATTTRIAKINVTSGTFSLTGGVTWMSNSAVETEVITVSTGTINFGTSITMGSASGTIGVSSTGTINFNGATVPSLTFGGATAPVLNSASGCTLHFEKGFANATTALTFVSGANVTVGSESNSTDITIDPGTTITNNGHAVVYGTLTSGGASNFVNGANAILEVRGNLSANVTLNASASGNTVKYNGNGAQSVKATAYHHLVLENAGAKTLGSGITIAGNLTVQGSSTIATSAEQTVAGTFTYASSGNSTLSHNLTTNGFVISSGVLNDGGNSITVNGAGGWTNNGGTYTTTGAVHFTGGAAQTIGGSAATTFRELNINNAAGVTLNVSPAAPTVIANTLTLSSGVINTSSTNPLRLLDNATSSEGSNSSYVSGPMVKVGDDDFTFPVGKGGRRRKLGVSGLTSNTTEVTAEYFAEGYSSLTPLSGELLAVATEQYWMIDRTGSADPVRLRFYWENPSYVGNCEALKIAHWKDGQWQEEPSAVVPGSYCNNTGTGSIETTAGVTSFSPFTFGDGGSSLPIELVSFDAKPEGSTVKTTWVTAMEINNEYFTVEKSTDGINFTEVTKVPGAGNSTELLSYQSVDMQPFNGLSYYRLKQTDYDGAFAYSGIVAVNRSGEIENSVTLYPNPTSDVLHLIVANPGSNIQVIIYDLAGREMYGRLFDANGSTSNQLITLEAKYLLPSGTYVVSVMTNGTEHRQKLVLN